MKTTKIIAGMFVLLASTSVQASLVSVSQAGPSSFGGSAQIIAAPAQVTNSVAFNIAQQGFDERQDVLLLAARQHAG